MIPKSLSFVMLFITSGALFAQATVRSTVGVNGNSTTTNFSGKQYIVQQSVGQASVIGNHTIQDFTVLQGFIQPPITIEGATDEDNSLQAVIYPNPFSNFIRVRFSEETDAPLSVTLYDIAGRVVFSKEMASAREIQLDLNFLSSASYLIYISQANKQFTATLIKN
jgi:hypothetical protein